MTIGACRVRLRLPENQSLKSKRQVVKSVTAQVRNTFNVSIAEVEDQELWQVATLGIVCVSNNGQHVNATLSKVVDFVSQTRLDIEMLDYEIEILPVL